MIERISASAEAMPRVAMRPRLASYAIPSTPTMPSVAGIPMPDRASDAARNA